MNQKTRVEEPGTLLAQAKATASGGRREEAHQLLIQVTERQPHSVEAWLWRAATAATREGELVGLSAALELDPENEQAQLAMYEALKRQLEDDAFVAYVDETDEVYQVQTADTDRVVVPKRRAVPRPYPPREPRPLRPVSRWLLLASVGLLPSGLGALLIAPIALISALRLPPSALGHEDRKRRRVFIAVALILWILGLLLSLLVLIHL